MSALSSDVVGGLGELNVEGDGPGARAPQGVDHPRVVAARERPLRALAAAPQVVEGRLVDADDDNPGVGVALAQLIARVDRGLLAAAQDVRAIEGEGRAAGEHRGGDQRGRSGSHLRRRRDNTARVSLAAPEMTTRPRERRPLPARGQVRDFEYRGCLAPRVPRVEAAEQLESFRRNGRLRFPVW